MRTSRRPTRVRNLALPTQSHARRRNLTHGRAAIRRSRPQFHAHRDCGGAHQARNRDARRQRMWASAGTRGSPAA